MRWIGETLTHVEYNTCIQYICYSRCCFFLILQFLFILYSKKLKKNKRNARGLNKEVSQAK